MSVSRSRPVPGSQTLARGLTALEYIAQADQGLTVLELAQRLGVHRTIAYRLLLTLSDFRMTMRGTDGRYRIGSGVVALGQGYHAALRETIDPVMRELSTALECTISLLVQDGDEAVAISVTTPKTVNYGLSFQTGSRHPIGLGSAGYALLAAGPPMPGESERITRTRREGYALTHGEVEAGIYGLAVPIPTPEGSPHLCFNLISHRLEHVEEGRESVMAAAQRAGALLLGADEDDAAAQ